MPEEIPIRLSAVYSARERFQIQREQIEPEPDTSDTEETPNQ